MKYPFQNVDVELTYNKFPDVQCAKLLWLRNLIFEQAEANLDIGEIEESLKWGQPSYVSKYGTPIRLGIEKKSPEKIGLYVNCNTKVIETAKHIYDDKLNFGGNRSILFSHDVELPEIEIRHIINIAISYYL